MPLVVPHLHRVQNRDALLSARARDEAVAPEKRVERAELCERASGRNGRLRGRRGTPPGQHDGPAGEDDAPAAPRWLTTASPRTPRASPIARRRRAAGAVLASV